MAIKNEKNVVIGFVLLEYMDKKDADMILINSTLIAKQSKIEALLALSNE